MTVLSSFQRRLATLDLDIARAVVEHYIAKRARAKTAGTKKEYENRVVGELTLHALRAYREESGIPFNSFFEMRDRRAGDGQYVPGLPIAYHLEQFLRRSSELKVSSWQLIRSALLHWLACRYQETEGQQQSTYIGVLAVLIAITKPVNFQTGSIRGEVEQRPLDSAFVCELLSLIESPTIDEIRETNAEDRAKFITFEQWCVLSSELDKRGGRGRQARLLFQATLTIGARASEWKGATLRAVTPADYEGLPSIAALMALDVPTGKLKAGVAPIMRTFLITDESVLRTVDEHLGNIQDRARANSKDPVGNWLRDCSTLIRKIAEQFIPSSAARITLRTARSQARAEFVVGFDDYIAAAALGHSARVGRRHYGLRKHATGFSAGVTPAAEVVRRGAALRQAHQASAARQAWLYEPRSNETGNAPSDSTP